ncbi:unnamed protein product [Sphacelaria rigidula]
MKLTRDARPGRSVDVFGFIVPAYASYLPCTDTMGGVCFHVLCPCLLLPLFHCCSPCYCLCYSLLEDACGEGVRTLHVFLLPAQFPSSVIVRSKNMFVLAECGR